MAVAVQPFIKYKIIVINKKHSSGEMRDVHMHYFIHLSSPWKNLSIFLSKEAVRARTLGSPVRSSHGRWSCVTNSSSGVTTDSECFE